MAKKPLPQEKPKAISILEVKRTRSFIVVTYELGDETHRVRSNENPLPEFQRALSALTPIILAVAELPTMWGTDVTVHGLSIAKMRDVRTASVHAKKGVELSSSVLEISTPPALLSQPQTEGAVTPPLAPELIDLVETAIEEAKRYVRGERAQGTLDLDEEAEVDGEDDGEQPAELKEPRLIDVPSQKPRRKRKPAADDAGE